MQELVELLKKARLEKGLPWKKSVMRPRCRCALGH